MRDLTDGPLGGHLAAMAIPIAIGMVFQTLYYLVDLYFVGQLGESAIAGLTSAGNVQFLVMAVTQVLGVGTMALIAQAVGRRDIGDATLIFNQSLSLAAVFAAATLGFGYALARPYMELLGAGSATVDAGTTYLFWFLPGLGLQFALISMGAALRGTGIVTPTIVVQIMTVILNAILAPVMIAGWGTGRPLGIAGAGLSSTIAVGVGVLALGAYYLRIERTVVVQPGHLLPRMSVWWRILRIGLPPGGEFALLFVYLGVVYWVIRDFGAEAQAGFGIGSRVMQAVFLPAMAIAFAAAPVAGQNVGAGRDDRVRLTLRTAALWSSVIMLGLTLLCQIRPGVLIRGFTDDPAVLAVGAEFLRIISWNFVATGLIFTCSSLFQALGNTVPSLVASATRLATFALPAVLLSTWSGFQLRHLWTLSVVTVALQALAAWWLLSIEFRRRLPAMDQAVVRSPKG